MINLKQLRIDNNLSQIEIAQYLGVSRGYISIIETGKNTLPKNLVDLIFNDAEKLWGWDLKNFNPPYYRLTTLIKALSKIHPQMQPVDKNEDNPFGLDAITMSRIKYGKQELTPQIVENICHWFPECNAEYLLSGEGSPLNLAFEKDPEQNKGNEESNQLTEICQCLTEISRNLTLLATILQHKR